MESEKGNTVDRTPVRGCVPCARKWRHELPVLYHFHPYAGHGYTKEAGWTHPDLEPRDA